MIDTGKGAKLLPNDDTPRDRKTLTQRAGLSFAAKASRMLVRAVVALVTTPLILSGVGLDAYGLWSMIQKVSAYVTLADFRAAGATKLLLSVRQHEDDPEAKRRIVGASFVIWLAFLPLLVLVGYLIIANVRSLFPVDTVLQGPTRWALGIFLCGIMLNRILALPNNILYAMNLGYKAFVAEVTVPLVTGGLMVWAVLAGYGLPGLAVATLIGLVLDGAIRHVIAVRCVDWYGAARPTKPEIGAFTRICGWMQVNNLSSLLLWGADVLIVGKLMGAASAAIFFQTGFVHRLAAEGAGMIFQSGKPGLAGLLGDRQWERAGALREEMHVLTLGIVTLTGAMMLAFNESFITLWLGNELYAGTATNTCFVGASMLTILIRNESMFLDGLLAVRAKSVAMLAAGILTIGLGIALTLRLGMVGMALAGLFGLLVGTVLIFILVDRESSSSLPAVTGRVLRVGLLSLGVLVASFWFKDLAMSASWPTLIIKGIAGFVVLSLTVWFVVFDRAARAAARLRVDIMLGRGGGVS